MSKYFIAFVSCILMCYCSVLYADRTVMVDNNGKLTYPNGSKFTTTNNIVTVDSNGKLVNPSTSTFISANNLGGGASTAAYICVRANTYWGTFPSSNTNVAYSLYYGCEAELKVLDENGYLIYHASTFGLDGYHYHRVRTVHDPNCKIFYYVSLPNNNNPCVSSKKRLNYNWGSHNWSIAELNNPKIVYQTYPSYHYYSNISVTTIEFYPNLDGETTDINGNTHHEYLLPHLNSHNIREIFSNPKNTIVVSIKNTFTHQKDANGKRIWFAPTIIYQNGTLE